MTNNVLIYRDVLLAYPETFIPAQVGAMKRYSGFYAGTLKNHGLADLIPGEQKIMLVNHARHALLSRLSFKLFNNVEPSWLRAISHINPRLIHAHYGPDGVWCLPIARELNIPLIVTFHGYDAMLSGRSSNLPGLSFRLYLRRLKRLFQEARICIAVSDFVRESLLARGCPPEKILVHYIGVDTKKFQPQPNCHRQEIVLFVGRLVEIKGCEYLIKAMAQIQSSLDNIELVIIGDGDLRPSLEQLAGSILKKYRFLGFQPAEVVRDWMARSRVFCVPSITEAPGLAEAFGLVFAEAQSMGLPVVSYHTGGIPEVVSHGETGYLATERNVDELAAYILRLLEDRSMWQRFSQNGIEIVNTRFNLHKQTQILEKIYDAVLEPKIFENCDAISLGQR